MENMTVDQVGLYYSKIKKFEYEYQENQAKLVWILMNGWGSKKEASLDKAKELGILKDTV